MNCQVGSRVPGNLGTHSELYQNERKSMSNYSNMYKKHAEINCQMSFVPLGTETQETRNPHIPTDYC
jgi:hypothetical protein